jgi:hypothetical protein
MSDPALLFPLYDLPTEIFYFDANRYPEHFRKNFRFRESDQPLDLSYRPALEDEKSASSPVVKKARSYTSDIFLLTANLANLGKPAMKPTSWRYLPVRRFILITSGVLEVLTVNVLPQSGH